jgi:hypothetical protein
MPAMTTPPLNPPSGTPCRTCGWTGTEFAPGSRGYLCDFCESLPWGVPPYHPEAKQLSHSAVPLEPGDDS